MSSRKLVGTIVEVYNVVCKDDNYCHKECPSYWPSVGCVNCALFRVRLKDDSKGALRCDLCKQKAVLATLSKPPRKKPRKTKAKLLTPSCLCGHFDRCDHHG